MSATKVLFKINNNAITNSRHDMTAVRTTHAVNRFGVWLVFFGEYLKTSKIPGTPAEDWESLVLNIYTLYFIGSKWNILEDFPHPARLRPRKKMFIYIFFFYRRRPRLRRVTMWLKVVALFGVLDIWFIFAYVTFIFFPTPMELVAWYSYTF